MSFNFVSLRLVSFRFASFHRFAWLRSVLFRFVPFHFVSFRLVSCRFISFRLVAFRVVSFRVVSCRRRRWRRKTEPRRAPWRTQGRGRDQAAPLLEQSALGAYRERQAPVRAVWTRLAGVGSHDSDCFAGDSGREDGHLDLDGEFYLILLRIILGFCVFVDFSCA